MKLTSPVFKNIKNIPRKYTCDGENINPPLLIEEIPSETKSLVLIVDDPDAPEKTFVHWVVYNIPVANEIKENSIPGIQGINDFQQINYGGPCPPSGEHRYFFKLFALNTALDLPEGSTKEQVIAVLRFHMIAQAQLIGVYTRA